MNRDDLLRKIRACLQLSKSANEHEAAAALRQAQALMRMHGVSCAEALAGDVQERSAKTGRRGADVHQSMHLLIQLVGTLFRCQSVLSCGVGSPVVCVFYGVGADPEIAAYALAALRVQMDRACKARIARVRKRENREARGEVFRRGWVAAVHRMMLSELAPSTLDEIIKAKQVAYKAARFERIEPATGKSITAKAIKASDFVAGIAAGKNARLNSGIGGTKQGALEHTS